LNSGGGNQDNGGKIEAGDGDMVANIGWWAGGVVVAVMFGALAGALAASPDITAFLAENRVAMDKMMTGMHIKSSGDVDRDFAAMMIPHHQGAIDMAKAELRYGHNEQLRRLAQQIIVDQQREIAVMQTAVGQPPPAGMPGMTMKPAP
jgi:hypothetical protein